MSGTQHQAASVTPVHVPKKQSHEEQEDFGTRSTVHQRAAIMDREDQEVAMSGAVAGKEMS